MDEVTDVILGADEAIEEQPKSFVIASVASIGSGGVTLKFDESDTAGEKEYRGNTNQKIAVGDRVFAAVDSGTYVILCKIGKPGSDYPKNHIPSGGTDGQILAKNGTADYSLKWINAPSNPVPSGGSDGQVLVKDGTTNYALKWANMPVGNKVPTGGSAGQVLTKSSSADFALSWTTPSVSQLKNGSYNISISSAGTITPSSNNQISLGTSSYQFLNLYASGAVQLGTGSSGSVMLCASYYGKLGFFGKTPISKQTLASSATLAQVITALKNYGLFT